VQSDADPALWILHGENSTELSMFYVEDGLVSVAQMLRLMPPWSSHLGDVVASILEMRALGEPKDFLGLR
jgi:hypothetical protein